MAATYDPAHHYAVNTYDRESTTTLPDRFPTLDAALAYVARLPRSGTYAIIKLPKTK